MLASYTCFTIKRMYNIGINITAPARKSKGSFALICDRILINYGQSGKVTSCYIY